MENDRLEEIHKLYFSLIPLFYKCKTFYIDKNRADDLCNKNQAMAIMIIGKAKKLHLPHSVNLLIWKKEA